MFDEYCQEACFTWLLGYKMVTTKHEAKFDILLWMFPPYPQEQAVWWSQRDYIIFPRHASRTLKLVDIKLPFYLWCFTLFSISHNYLQEGEVCLKKNLKLGVCHFLMLQLLVKWNERSWQNYYYTKKHHYILAEYMFQSDSRAHSINLVYFWWFKPFFPIGSLDPS